MGISRITTVSAKMGMPRMAELKAMAQIMFFSPTRPTAHLVMRTAAPVFSRMVPMVQPRKMMMATLLIVPEKPLLMVPSMSCQGVPRAMAATMAAIRMPIAALTLNLEIRTIIRTITAANTTNTYPVVITILHSSICFVTGLPASGGPCSLRARRPKTHALPPGAPRLAAITLPPALEFMPLPEE